MRIWIKNLSLNKSSQIVCNFVMFATECILTELSEIQHITRLLQQLSLSQEMTRMKRGVNIRFKQKSVDVTLPKCLPPPLRHSRICTQLMLLPY